MSITMIVQVIVLIVVVVMILMSLRSSGKGGGASLMIQTPPLVIRKLFVSQDSAAHLQVEIVGRPSGILAALFSIFHIEQESHLLVTQTDVAFSTKKLSSMRHINFPLRRIQGTECGFRRSMIALILTVLLAIYTLLGLLGLVIEGSNRNAQLDFPLAITVLAAVCTLIMAAVSRFSKRFWIVISSGTPILKVQFKRGMDDIMVDLPKVNEITALVNKLVLNAVASYPVSASSVAPVHLDKEEHCLRCSALLDPGMKFCEAAATRLLSD